MKDHVGSALDELRSFMKGYGLKEISGDVELQSGLKKIFKRYYPVIVWVEMLSGPAILWGKVEKDKLFKLYLNEMASDLCFSVFISFQGMYKPSLIVLRSAIENFIRCIVIAYDKEIATTSVYELIAFAKSTALASDPVGTKYLRDLIGAYGQLCAYVHSADELHMSLTKVVGNFPRYKPDEFMLAGRFIKDFCLNSCSILSLTLPRTLARMHHSHRDLISDVLPREVRRALHDRIN